MNKTIRKILEQRLKVLKHGHAQEAFRLAHREEAKYPDLYKRLDEEVQEMLAIEEHLRITPNPDPRQFNLDFNPK